MIGEVAAQPRDPMLRFVLRDGLEAVERIIKENAVADAQFASGASLTTTMFCAKPAKC
jgi:hypothetical protein